jgi:hypothetical protein
VFSYLRDKGNEWIGILKSKLKKCVAKKFGNEIKSLFQIAAAKLYIIISKPDMDLYTYADC